LLPWLLIACTSTTSPPVAGRGSGTAATAPAPYRTLTFPAPDGVPITADLYAPHPPTAPFIVLFHQAGFSRGEYREIAPRLGELGFNCLAVDQRAGEGVDDVANETAAAAVARGKPTDYLAAIADMRAAIAVVRRDHARGRLILWGSSYSAALVLVLGADQAIAPDAVVAFSPGEYFEDLGKPADWIATQARGLAVPVFLTSARDEAAQYRGIAAAIVPARLTAFVPTGKGRHGASALWPREADHAAYWTAITGFLRRVR
jgi:predicted alpha/beta hydrolase